MSAGGGIDGRAVVPRLVPGSMNVLILKRGASGDVVRTTPLLRRFRGPVTWVTDAGNKPLLEGVAGNPTALSWEERDLARDSRYDLVMNLEEDAETAAFGRAGPGGALTNIGACRFNRPGRDLAPFVDPPQR